MDIFKKLFEFGKEKTAYMVIALILSGIATILSLLPYYFFWKLLIEVNSRAEVSVVEQTVIVIFALTVAHAIVYFLALCFSHVFAFRIETNMKKMGIKHLLDASFSFFDMNPSGKTRKIIDDNSANTHTVVAHMLPDTVNAVLFPIGFLLLAFYVNIYAGLIIVGAVIFAMICFKMMYEDPKMMEEYMEALEDINSETVEYVRGIQIVKIYDMVVHSFEKLHKAILRYSQVVNRSSQQSRVPYTLFQASMAAFPALIILIAFKMMGENQSPVEIISLVVFFIAFAVLLNNAFMKIMFFNRNYQQAADAINKLTNLFENMEKHKLISGKIEDFAGYDIEMDNISFEYEEGVRVLQDFSLKLESGKTYALVGESGGGKSTIAKLISGFYPVSAGSLKIGGIDITEYTAGAVEKNIAFVFQNSKLFKTTIYENVKIGNPKASHEEIMQAMQYAMCQSILDKFETAENTVIGAKGVHLSGGEVQRIAIARAILKNAPIVIMDEASAASDPENEYEMQQAFTKLMKGKTVIMIAHRLSSIRNVDEILVVEGGKIIERGSHEELIEKAGRYLYFQNLFSKANEWRL
ncbi:MAG: ABC transporter ATP-binding protein [Eubacteriales bacterium]